MRSFRGIVWVLCAGLCAGAASASAAPPEAPTVDTATLKDQFAPRAEEAGTLGPETAEPAWKPQEAVERERRGDAMRVGQSYVSDHLQDWLDDTPLAAVERLRRTDLVVGRGAGGLDVRLRVAEAVRLTVARDDFRRDLLYDPIRARMSMDLYRTDLGDARTGLALTDSYELDQGANRLLLQLRHTTR